MLTKGNNIIIILPKKGGEMKVKVDENLCTGCGLCVDVCPEVFEIGDDVSTAKVDNIPSELEEKVREAAESCPVEAIIIEE